MTSNQWKLLLGGTSAVIAYLLVQTDLTFEPWAKVLLGAASVFLAVFKTGEAPEV